MPDQSTLITQPVDQSVTQQFLSFYINHHIQVMLPIQNLAEILSVSISQIIPIPDVSDQVIGVFNWRGEVLWLSDLSRLLGNEPLLTHNYHQSNYNAVIAHYQGCYLGLIVDHVGQIVWCNSTQIQPLPATYHDLHSSPYIQGYWLNPQGKTLLILDTKTLVHAFQ
jgi:positive phototaxis protein PixI